jgi:hypothetical protein
VLVVRHKSTLSATTLLWDGLVMRSIKLPDRMPTHGYAATREAAMAALAKSWRRE